MVRPQQECTNGPERLDSSCQTHPELRVIYGPSRSFYEHKTLCNSSCARNTPPVLKNKNVCVLNLSYRAIKVQHVDNIYAQNTVFKIMDGRIFKTPNIDSVKQHKIVFHKCKQQAVLRKRTHWCSLRFSVVRCAFSRNLKGEYNVIIYINVVNNFSSSI